MRISDWSSDVCSSDLPVFGQISPLKRPFGAVSSHGSLKEILATPCAQASVRRGNRNRLRPCMPVRFISSQYSLSLNPAMHSSVRVDRKSDGAGKSVSVRVDLGGGGTMTKNQHPYRNIS